MGVGVGVDRVEGGRFGGTVVGGGAGGAGSGGIEMG